MEDVAIIGVSMTHFGKHPQKTLKDVGMEAALGACKDASIDPKSIQAAYVGNGLAGIMTGQEGIRGQSVLLGPDSPFQGIPVVNVEDACATSSIALQCAMNAVASGMYENALVLGVEKLFDDDKMKPFLALSTDMPIEMRDAIVQAMSGSIDKDRAREQLKRAGLLEDMIDVILTALGDGSGVGQRSPFMDVYAMEAHLYAKEYGIPLEDVKNMLAWIAAKNHTNGSLNPFAQYQKPCSPAEVLESRLIVEPLHLLMCSPIGDGAAAAVITKGSIAKRLSEKPVWIAASVANSEAWQRKKGDPDCVARAAKKAYETAGIGPEDVNVAEVHDATAVGELLAYEELGFAEHGQAQRLISEEATSLAGKVPVNTSGGLESKGHPIGATGLAMIVEVVWQLRGEANKRQVENARVGLTQNGGGVTGAGPACMTVTVLKR